MSQKMKGAALNIKTAQKRSKISLYNLVLVLCPFTLSLNFCDTKGYFLIPSGNCNVSKEFK